MIYIETIFWILIWATFYVYAGYPLILYLLRPKDIKHHESEEFPFVTLFIPAYNEERVIGSKILNSLSLDYPEDKLEIVVASDASTDGTADEVSKFSDKGIKLFKSIKRGGKNSIINEFIGDCTGEIIVFTDANCFFEKDAVKLLAEKFTDRRIGLVVGRLKYVDEKSSVGKGEGLYFRYESMIKKMESAFGTLVAATGSIYAIRRELFTKLDSDVANDLAHPIQVSSKGYKIVFEERALAVEKATVSAKEEFSRRARIVTRGMTAFMRYWRKYGMLKGMWGFCFVSHKLIRWFIPFLLVGIFATNIFLESFFYNLFFFLQCGFYFLAAGGCLMRKKVGKIFSVPFYFTLVNLAAMTGVLKYFAGKRQSVWDVAETTR